MIAVSPVDAEHRTAESAAVPTGDGDRYGEFKATLSAPSGRIGRYQIDRLLGRGTGSRVYHAVDTFTGEQVAVKMLNLRPRGGPGTGDPARRQFLNEARLAGRLGHPHIAAII